MLAAAAILVQINPETIGWVMLAAAAPLFFVGIVVWRRENWSNSYENKFSRHISTVYAALDEAYGRFRENGSRYKTWKQLCAHAEWALSYNEVTTDSGELLLEFAKSIYPEDPAIELRSNSTVDINRFDAFHDPARRSIAHFLAAAGKQMRRSWCFRRWLAPRLESHKHLVHMIIYLAMPLKMRTTNGASNDLHDTGFAYYPDAFKQ